jgi:hypothetical protein
MSFSAPTDGDVGATPTVLSWACPTAVGHGARSRAIGPPNRRTPIVSWKPSTATAQEMTPNVAEMTIRNNHKVRGVL